MIPKKSMNFKDKIGLGIIGLTALASYPLLQIPIQASTYLASPNMSIDQSINLIEQEKNNYDFEGKIELIVKDGFFEPYVLKENEVYKINIQKNSLKKPFLKHELCHIFKGHLDEKVSGLTKVYKLEPEATLCQFGLDIKK